jgi:hypothetical protein
VEVQSDAALASAGGGGRPESDRDRIVQAAFVVTLAAAARAQIASARAAVAHVTIGSHLSASSHSFQVNIHTGKVCYQGAGNGGIRKFYKSMKGDRHIVRGGADDTY